MPIDFKLSKVVVKNFRGVADLTLELRDGYPSVLIGANNAGKSTVMNAISLAIGGGDFYQWTPETNDFYCDPTGKVSKEFLVQVHFSASHEEGYPAVRGVGKAVFVHGVQVKGKAESNGRLSHSRTLIGPDLKPISFSTRTPQTAEEKKRLAEHGVGYSPIYARTDDIREHIPEVWRFTAQNIEASLFHWKRGPLQRLSRYLAERFLADEWTLKSSDGHDRPMPQALSKAYGFFREAIDKYPFWQTEMKPTLETVFARYVGTHATIDLRPDVPGIEEWLARQLAISLATDPEAIPTPLKSMGDGWQSVIRLAALEAVNGYPGLMKDRVVLLMEEPETHLHPHLRRKIRKVLASLSKKGWTVIYTTHSPELVSFDADQIITRLVRTKGNVVSRSVDTSTIDAPGKLQSKLDDRGAHDFLFGTAAVFCEGKEDQFAVRQALDQFGMDIDSRSVSVTQVEGVTAMPSFTAISNKLGIRWCALTDEDLLADGTVKPKTKQCRDNMSKHVTPADLQTMWPVSLEECFGIAAPHKATVQTLAEELAGSDWQTKRPVFRATVAGIAAWIDPEFKA